MKYHMYVGEKIPSVNVFKVEGEKEYPIYANTRGRTEWYTFDVDYYENTEQSELSNDLIAYLAHYYRVRENKLQFDSDSMYFAEMIKNDKPDVDLEWYEIEFLNVMGDPRWTPEQEELLEWAYNEVQE